MPELPEMEAWRRAFNDPVSAFPIEHAGPAHIATLKTFDPPLSTLEGRRLAGAERRAKRLLFPTEDGELVLLVHLMSAGRIRYLVAGEKGPKKPAFRLGFQGGGELVLTEAGAKKRAGVWLLTPEAAEAELAHLGPEALGLGAEQLGEILAEELAHPLDAAEGGSLEDVQLGIAGEQLRDPIAVAAVQRFEQRAHRSRRDSRRSLSTRPPVWHSGQ